MARERTVRRTGREPKPAPETDKYMLGPPQLTAGAYRRAALDLRRRDLLRLIEADDMARDDLTDAEVARHLRRVEHFIEQLTGVKREDHAMLWLLDASSQLAYDLYESPALLHTLPRLVVVRMAWLRSYFVSFYPDVGRQVPAREYAVFVLALARSFVRGRHPAALRRQPKKWEAFKGLVEAMGLSDSGEAVESLKHRLELARRKLSRKFPPRRVYTTRS